MVADYYPTDHLREKMKARNVTWAEIVDILEHPEVSFGPDFKDKRVLQKGDLAVVVGRDNAVITVLLRDADQWTDEQAASRYKTQPHFLALLEHHSELIDILKQFPTGVSTKTLIDTLNFKRRNDGLSTLTWNNILNDLEVLEAANVAFCVGTSEDATNRVWALKAAYL